MRVPSSSMRQISASATDLTTRLRDRLNVRLTWPRVTTGRLMILIAVVAVGIWGYRDVPEMIDRTRLCEGHANVQAASERDFRENAQASRARARAIRAELDQLRNSAEKPNPLTERYHARRLESESLNIQYCEFMAEFHARRKQQFLDARWHPWSPLPSKVDPPPDPFSKSNEHTAPDQGDELIDGGVTLAFAPKGQTLAVACRDRSIKLLELPSRRVRARWPLPGDDLDLGHGLELAFSPDGATLYAISGNHPLWRWDVATGEARRALPWFHPTPDPLDPLPHATSIQCSPNGETIAIAANRPLRNSRTPVFMITLLDGQTGALKWQTKIPGPWVLSVVFSPDGQTLACAGGTAVLLDAQTGQLKQTLKPKIGNVMALAFSPDGQTLAGAGSSTAHLGDRHGSGQVTLWDLPTRRILRTLDGPTVCASRVAFAPDGQTIVAGGLGPSRDRWIKHQRSFASMNAGEVRLWNVATGAPIWTVETDFCVTSPLVFSPDGQSLAFCALEDIHLLDAQTGKLLQIVMEAVVRPRR